MMNSFTEAGFNMILVMISNHWLTIISNQQACCWNPTEPMILRPLSLMDRKSSNFSERVSFYSTTTTMSHRLLAESSLLTHKTNIFSSKNYFCFRKFSFWKLKFYFQENERKNYTFQWIWILQERRWVQWMYKSSPAAFFNFQQQQYLMKSNYSHQFLANQAQIQQPRFVNIFSMWWKTDRTITASSESEELQT